MFTPVISSLIETASSRLQSPVHGATLPVGVRLVEVGGVTVNVGLVIGVGVSVGNADVLVALEMAVAAAVAVRVTVGV